jgi:hypothetical protein
VPLTPGWVELDTPFAAEKYQDPSDWFDDPPEASAAQ